MKFELKTKYPEIPGSWYFLGEYAKQLDTITKELKNVINTSDIKEVISTAELLVSICTRAQDIALNIFAHIGVRRCENNRCCQAWYKNLQDTKNLFCAYVRDLENM